MKVHYMAYFKRPQPDMKFNYERIQYLVQNEGSSVYVRLWEYDEKVNSDDLLGRFHSYYHDKPSPSSIPKPRKKKSASPNTIYLQS
ncbi:hypothetical protein AYI69_g8576 [Smittium culicis]|uniref:Uncharacterized protein n=1 Tax=Smittium culicis TaxID=133412 RepID=A0A1R1XIP7_9FUNG|nr:hypothetical protein AYI69_g8576 [Smittium culicis]